MPRHFLTLRDLSRAELLAILENADFLRKKRGTPEHPQPLAGQTIALIFEKSSTRTRVSFEVAARELGAAPITLSQRDIQLGRGETIEDTARTLSCYVHGIVYRTSAHERVERLASAATVPVINGLTDDHHPVQLLADLRTILDERKTFEGLRVAWIGDGNNVAVSWLEAADIVGFDLALACPSTHRPPKEFLDRSPRARVVEDPLEAAKGAHVVVTDVWASMGQEGEASQRASALSAYFVGEKTMAVAAPDAIFLHCLPAHRGEEVEAAVIDGPQSRVWIEAEHRLHTQKALLVHLGSR